jgi:transposase
MTKKFEELTDSQWCQISVFFNTKRKRKNSLRDVVNALLYMVRTGCQWRNLPSSYPHWRAVNYYFEQWKRDGTIQNINDALNQQDRIKSGKDAAPTLMCIDSQSVKLSPMIYEHRGIDANKKVNGRKRQFLVDSDGRIWDVLVHAANTHDGTGSCAILSCLKRIGQRVEKIVGDAAYKKTFAEKVEESGCTFECGSKPESRKGFVPIAHRWVVERTISWTNFFRRIVKDYEYTLQSSKSWVILANIAIIFNRNINWSE